MSDPNDLQALLDEAWRHLRRGVADARAPARYPTFTTVSPEGRPEARTVALRRADREAAEVEVHTDSETAKVQALRRTPYAAPHVWVPRARFQIRLTMRVDILTGPEVEPQWQRVPPASRISYGTVPTPGTPIPKVYAYDKTAERARFVVLRCQVTDIDLVHLGDPHRRAMYHREEGWTGTWIAP